MKPSQRRAELRHLAGKNRAWKILTDSWAAGKWKGNERTITETSRISRKRREETGPSVLDFTGGDSIGACVTTVEEEESDTGREFSMRLTPPTLALPRTMPDPCYARSFRRQGGTTRPEPSFFRFQISGYDLSRRIDYLERRYFHIPVVDFATVVSSFLVRKDWKISFWSIVSDRVRLRFWSTGINFVM